MKQYCRYCAFCFEADDFRCSNHPKGLQPEMTEAQIKRPNNCPNFALCDLGDVITGRQYKPRPERPKEKAKQLSLFDKEVAKQLSLFDET